MYYKDFYPFVSNLWILVCSAPTYFDFRNIFNYFNEADDISGGVISGVFPTLCVDIIDTFDFKYIYAEGKNYRSFIPYNWYLTRNFLDYVAGSTGMGYNHYLYSVDKKMTIGSGLYCNSLYGLNPAYELIDNIAELYKYKVAVQDMSIKTLFDPFFKGGAEHGSADDSDDSAYDLDDLLRVPKCLALPSYGFVRSLEDTDDISSVIDVGGDDSFYFIVRGVGKFCQQYLFTLQSGKSLYNIVKVLPIIVRSILGPDLDWNPKWKSSYSTYTYLYNGSGVNPFEVFSFDIGLSTDHLLCSNPIFYVVYNSYRFIETSATASREYGLLFNAWWPLRTDDPDRIWDVKQAQRKSKSITYLDIGDYSLLEGQFGAFKQFLVFELDSVDIIYTSYCGDHDFYIDSVTPRVLDRTSDVPMRKDEMKLELPSFVDGEKYARTAFEYSPNVKTMLYDPVMPYNRAVGYMWFPYRSCEVARYNETLDYANKRSMVNDDGDVIYQRGPGAFCYDLIFKPYGATSDFSTIFVDDLFGSISPFRYLTITDIPYIGASTGGGFKWYKYPGYDVGCSPIRSISVQYDDVYIDPFGKVAEDISGPYIILNNTADSISLGDMYEMSATGDAKGVQVKSFLYDILSFPTIPPYNVLGNRCVVGYERKRMGDANFIYQAFYPYHKRCKVKALYYYTEYGNGGEECYGDDYSKYLLPMCDAVGPDILPLIYDGAGYPLPDWFGLGTRTKGTFTKGISNVVISNYWDLFLGFGYWDPSVGYFKISTYFDYNNYPSYVHELREVANLYQRYGEPYASLFICLVGFGVGIINYYMLIN